MRGIDYAWASPKPDPAILKADGVMFVMRYISEDPSKDLTASERDGLLGAGIAIGLVWEVTGHMHGGKAAGVAAATASEAFVNSMAMPKIPVYFACDEDPGGLSAAEWAAVDAYLDGAATVLGRDRTGGYGGYGFIRHCFDHGKVTWGWQTYAWSYNSQLDKTNWDTRAQLRQVANSVPLIGLPGLDCDLDDSMTADFGQWPRPGGPPPPVPYQWTEFDMSKLPVLQTGSADVLGGGFWYVHRLQALLAETGKLQGLPEAAGLADDGVFGPATDAAVRAVQDRYQIGTDGIAGAKTWSVLLTGSA